MNRGNLGATVVGFLVAGIILAILIVVIGAGEVLAAIGRAQPPLVGLVGMAILTWIVLWGAGLRVVLGAIGADVSLADAVLVNAGAAFANHVTPFGQAGGEPVAAWLLSDLSTADFEEALAAVTSFDTINVIPSLAMAGLALTYYISVTTVSGRFEVIGIGVGLLGVALLVTIAVAWRYRATVERWLVRLSVPPLRGLQWLLPFVKVLDPDTVEARIETFLEGIARVAGDRRRLLLAVIFSTAGWLVQAGGLWIAFQALGATVPVYVPLFVVPLGTIASVLPTPGGLGGIEAVQVTLLVAATDVTAATITAAVAIFSVGGFFLTTTVGAGAVAILQTRERTIHLP